MTPEEKKAFANEAERAIFHPMVEEVMEEYAGNMGFELKGLPRYGLLKVAHFAASVARAHALGIDPEELRLTPTEAVDAQRQRLQAALDAGVTTIIVDGGEL